MDDMKVDKESCSADGEEVINLIVRTPQIINLNLVRTDQGSRGIRLHPNHKLPLSGKRVEYHRLFT